MYHPWKLRGMYSGQGDSNGKSGSKEKFHPFYFPTDQTTCITVYWFTVYLPWLGFQRWKWLCKVLICESNKNSEPNDFTIYNM